jgi:3-hydroxyisobutyrate dehydrogenase-like beta-hydroxyacid dehydrogenase/predicted ester cyclase
MGVAMIGLGAMGGAMAHRLLERGHPVSVWNRSAEKAAGLAQAGARVASTPRDAAAGASAVLASVADGDALAAVLEGPDGALAGLAPGAVVVNLSTVDPAQLHRLAETGVELLDAGVLGNARHARSGELRVYAGGDAGTLARVRPLLDDLAKQVRHVGALGAGMELKLALNLVMGLEMQALGEAVAYGVSRGLDRGLVLEAIAESGFSAPVMSFKARRMAARRYEEPDFRLSLMAKDLALVASGAGVELPLAQSARATHEAAVGAGLGELDCAAILSAFEPGRQNGSGPHGTERNKAIVTRAEDAWNEGELDEAFSYFADDYREHTHFPMPGLTPDKRGLTTLLRAFRDAFPDGHVTIDVMAAEGDLVCYHSTARGTHTGEFMGIAPTGRPVEVGAIHIHRLAGGKIVEHWGRNDQMALMRQLGITPGGRAS